MKKLFLIIFLSLSSILSLQTAYAQTSKHAIKSKRIQKVTELDILNQTIRDSLVAKAKYIKAGSDTMQYANAENNRLKEYLRNDPDLYNSEKGQRMQKNIRDAQEANTFWRNKAFEIDITIRNLEFEKSKITGTKGSPKMNIKRMPVKVDESSGTITF